MSQSLGGTIANVFRQDPFSNVALSKLVQRNPYNPVGIGALDLFDPLPIRTKAVAVEQLQGRLMIVPTTARGAPPVERVTEKRQARYFSVPRLAHADTLYYEELQDIRDYEDQTTFMQVQTEVARRLSGPTGLQANMEFTRERLRLSAIQGILRDADDSIIFNWFAEFGITPAPEVVFNLLAESIGSLRPIISNIKRGMMRASGGAITMNTPIMAACGDKFWDALTNHVDVRQTYLNYTAAATLREANAFDSVPLFGITWFNYRGSDDTTTVAIPSNKAQFFPKAPGVFIEAMAPAEFMPWINTPGEKEYTISFEDMQRHAWRRFELYAYPLYICTRPETLWTATMDATAD